MLQVDQTAVIAVVRPEEDSAHCADQFLNTFLSDLT